MDLHVGIAMDVKNEQLFMRPICGYCNGCKKLATITIFICKYCIFEIALWKL